MVKSKTSRGYALIESLAFPILVLAAFMTRILPLYFGPYPFNNDGLTECAIASDIVGTGHLLINPSPIDGTTHSEATPMFNVLIAYVAASFGVDPFFCAQLISSVISVVTISALFLLGRHFAGDVRGGVAAAFLGLLMGTFVFTTASVWKESLGIALMLLILFSFLRRSENRYRFLCFFLLMILPLVHHSVTGMTLLMLAFPLTWSWYLAATGNFLRLRHLQDLLMLGVPGVWTYFYYSSLSFDRLQGFASPIKMALAVVAFILLCEIMFILLMMKNHSKWTFAPLPGLGIVAVIALDYLGYLYDYEPAVGFVYFLLVFSFAYMVSLSWYGAEVAVETKPIVRAVLLGLLLSPVTLVGYAAVAGFTSASHQIVYRTFDFVDIFIFIGCGIALSAVYPRSNRKYLVAGAALLLAAIVSFPFAYVSDLTGVRHDTNGFEVDAIYWIDDRMSDPRIVSDERVSYIASALVGVPQESFLPGYIIGNTQFPGGYSFIMEDSWTTEGVNDYPKGTVVIPMSNFSRTLQITNVVCISGPADDRAIVFLGSYIGPVRYGLLPIAWDDA